MRYVNGIHLYLLGGNLKGTILKKILIKLTTSAVIKDVVRTRISDNRSNPDNCILRFSDGRKTRLILHDLLLSDS